MGFFLPRMNSEPDNSKVRYQKTAESSTYVNPINISNGTTIDSSLTSFLKLKGNAATSAERYLTVRNQIDAISGDGEDPALKEEIEGLVSDLTTQQYIQFFFDAYMAPGGDTSDMKFRLGEVVSKAEIENVPYIGNNKNGRTYTPTNMELNFNLSGGGFNGGTIKYFNNLFPPFTNAHFQPGSGGYATKSIDKWKWDNNGQAYVLDSADIGTAGADKFDSNTLTSIRNLTYRGLSFKGVNDNISLLQKILEGATGIVSTYMTEWDISVYIQEKILDSHSIPCTSMNIKTDNPSGYYDKRAYCYGQLNAAVSKMSDTDVAINTFAWEPQNYPLSSYWTSYGSGTDYNGKDVILKVASIGLNGNELRDYGFSKDSFNSLPFNEKVKFFDYQGAAYSGWTTFDGLKNYQLLYTTALENLTAFDMLHLETQDKEFGWSPTGKFDCICSALEDAHFSNEDEPDYGEKVGFYEDGDWEFKGISKDNPRRFPGSKKYYKAYKVLDKDGMPTTAFGKMQYRDANTGTVLWEEYVMDSNGASISISTFNADTVLSLLNYGRDYDVKIKNGWDKFLKAIMVPASNGEITPNWWPRWTELLLKDEYVPFAIGIAQQFCDSFVGGAAKYDEVFKNGAGGVGAAFAIPKKKVFGLAKNDAPSSASYKQQSSSANSSTSVIGGEDTKSAPQNGVSQLTPGLYGGPHGRFAHPNSIQGFFEDENRALRNTPRVTFDGFVDAEYTFKWNKSIDDYNRGVNRYFGTPVSPRSPAACLKMLKNGFFEPANYKVKVKDYFPIDVPYVAKLKFVSGSEYWSLKAAHPGLLGVSIDYGKTYSILYFAPLWTSGGKWNTPIKFTENSPMIAYETSDLIGCKTKEVPTGTGSYSSSRRPNSLQQCMEFKEGGRPNDISSDEYSKYIQYATVNLYYRRSTSLTSGVSSSSYGGSTSSTSSYGSSSGYGGNSRGGYELLRVASFPVGDGSVLDEREIIYKEPLVISDFENTWQISKVFTYDIVKTSWWQSAWGNFVNFLKGKATVKGNYQKGERKVKYILRFKGNRKDNSKYTETVENEDGDDIVRTKKWSKDLYCTDNELTFRKTIFGDNKDMWKHPLFFASKNNKNPSLDSTVEIIQLPVKISEYEYIMADIQHRSCGRKRKVVTKHTGEFLEVDLNYNLDEDWLKSHDPMKFAGLDASKDPFSLNGNQSYRSIIKDVCEITPDDSLNIEDCLEMEDTGNMNTDETQDSAPCGPSMMAGLEGDDIDDIQYQAWYCGSAFTTYIPGLDPDISMVHSDTLKKIVSLSELAPFTVDSTYTATKEYFNEKLPDCKKYHIEDPSVRKGFSQNIKFQCIAGKIEPIRPLLYFEKSSPAYEVSTIPYYEERGEIYFNETLVSKLASLKDLYKASDTSNKWSKGKTCKDILDGCIRKLTTGASGMSEDTLFKETYNILKGIYKIYLIYNQETINSKKAKYISYSNKTLNDKPLLRAAASSKYFLVTTYKGITPVNYVEEIEEITLFKSSYKLINGEDLTEEYKLYEYSYDTDFSHEPSSIYICNLEKNGFVYDSGEYEDDPQGIPAKRTFVKELFYSDESCSTCILGTDKSKSDYEAIAADFDGVSVATAAERTAQIRKELAKSAYNQKFGDIFVDDFTKSRPKTKPKEGSYNFPNRGRPSWTYQYAAFTLWTPQQYKEIGAGALSLDACNYKPCSADKHRIVNKLFTQAFIAPSFNKEYDTDPTGFIPTDSLVGFNALYKAMVIQSNWIGIAKKFYVDLVNFKSARIIIEYGVGKDLLARTLPSLVGKDSLSDEDKDNIKYRYWIARAWDIFNSTKEAQGACFVKAKNKLDALLKDRYGNLAKSGSIKNLTPNELAGLYCWVRKVYDFLKDSDYQSMGNYMEAYLNVLYELRKYYINKRCNKVNGTLWNIRHIESSIPIVKDVTQTDDTGIEKLDGKAKGGMHAYNVVAKEVTNQAQNVGKAIIDKSELNKNMISHVFLKVEYVEYDDLELKAFLERINRPDFKLKDLDKEEQIYVFFPHNSKFGKLPFTDTYTLTSGDYYAEKAKFLSKKVVKESFRKQKSDGTYTSDFKEFVWDIVWKQNGFDTVENMLKDKDSHRYDNRAESIKAVLRDAYPEFENAEKGLSIAKTKIFYYDNSSDKMSEVMAAQTDPKDPIIVWGVADSVNLKNLMGSAAALENGTVDATSFYCNTGAKADYWRIKVPQSNGLPYYSDYNSNCMIEALTSVSQSIDYDETLTTILGPFAYSAYPIDETQENNMAMDILAAFGLSEYGNAKES